LLGKTRKLGMYVLAALFSSSTTLTACEDRSPAGRHRRRGVMSTKMDSSEEVEEIG